MLAVSSMRPLRFSYPVLNLVYVIKTRKVKKDVSVQQDNTKQFDLFATDDLRWTPDKW